MNRLFSRIPRATRALAAGLIGAALPLAFAPLAVAGPAAPLGSAQPELRVVSWNICGEAGGRRGEAGYCPHRNEPEQKAAQIKKLVDERQANVVMLQEVCGVAPNSHLELLRAQLGDGWDVRHASGARPDGRTDCRGALSGELGVALAVKGSITESSSANMLPADPSGQDKQTLPVLCASVQGWTTRVCTTHIAVGESERVAQQVKNVKAYLGTAANSGFVLGGDFNRNAGADYMKPLTDSFDRCIDGFTYHGWDRATRRHSLHELDHFFTDRAPGNSRFATCAIDTSRMDRSENEPTSGPPTGYSDHAPIFAQLPGAPVPGDLSGDGKPDLVAVDDTGKLRLYPGLGDGGVTGGHRVIGTGGWSGASVTHRGDFTGDGREDLLARIGNDLWLYPNTGEGSLGARIRIGRNWPADAQIVAAGDVTGDGHPDLVTRYEDKLWLYAGDPADRPQLKPRVRLGGDGWAPMTLSAAGDATGDGRPDLFVRDTRDDKLWLYRGRSDNTFGDRTLYGTRGWDTRNRPLITGAADANGDGVADLWATTADGSGTLLYYKGGTGTAGDPTDGDARIVGPTGWKRIQAIG
ncbi:FG-GAP-like repeat-containing protein [Streptomyces sp. NPDC045369]|uniref:FG-GAP-like repeat-containing protein n=3 Tax=unclassified Streptomyces TaxID=2593676 RepID=UPI0033D4C651